MNVWLLHVLSSQALKRLLLFLGSNMAWIQKRVFRLLFRRISYPIMQLDRLAVPLLVYADQKKDNWKSTQQQAKKAILLVETPLAESNVFLLGCALFPSKISCDPDNSKLTRAGLICHGFSRKRHKTVADSLCLLLIPQKETKQLDNNSWPVIPLFSVSYTLHAFVLPLSLSNSNSHEMSMRSVQHLEGMVAREANCTGHIFWLSRRHQGHPIPLRHVLES